MEAVAVRVAKESPIVEFANNSWLKFSIALILMAYASSQTGYHDTRVSIALDSRGH
jgi:hypothetical protein